MIVYKSEREIRYMRDAGRIVAEVLQTMQEAVAPGVTTAELDRLAEKVIRKRGAIPSFKGFPSSTGARPFPGSICASINEEVVHGIPGMRRLREGDIISIDVGAIAKEYHGDAAITLAVGEVIDPEIQRLLQTTQESLSAGIRQAIIGNRLNDISYAIQTVAEEADYGIVRDYVGHGIGRSMHEDPQIPNFGPPGKGVTLKAGMTLAIEPMLNMGTHEVESLSDGWTVVTRDRKPSAHFEHTVAIGPDGPEVLTRL